MFETSVKNDEIAIDSWLAKFKRLGLALGNIGYSILIRHRAAQRQVRTVQALFQSMRADKVDPNSFDFYFAMEMCSALGDQKGVLTYYEVMRDVGLQPLEAHLQLVDHAKKA